MKEIADEIRVESKKITGAKTDWDHARLRKPAFVAEVISQKTDLARVR